MNYLVIYLSNSEVTVTLNPNGNNLIGTTIRTNSLYSDSLLHQLRVVFNEGRLSMTVDGIERVSTEGKYKKVCNSNKYNYLLIILISSSYNIQSTKCDMVWGI